MESKKNEILFFFPEVYSWIFPMKCKEKKFNLLNVILRSKGLFHYIYQRCKLNSICIENENAFFCPKKCRSEREQNFFSSLAKPWCGKRFFFGMREKISFFDLKCQNKFWASFEKDVGCSCNHKCRSRQNNVENPPILYFWTQINLLRECRNWKYQLECKEFENSFAKVNPWNKCLGTKLIWIIFMV